jgi:hypothetical protein
MSNHLPNFIKCSGGILSIYCLSLAIVPTAYAGDTNISNGSGFNISNASGYGVDSFNSFASSSFSISGGNGGNGGVTGGTAGTGEAGGTLATNETGSKANIVFGPNRLANIRGAQVLQSRLDAAQSVVDRASASVAKLIAASPTPPTPDVKLPAVRFARQVTLPGECGCNNPDVATKPADNSAAELAARELAAAKEVQAKAATELAEIQAQTRLYLAAAKKASEVSAQNTTFSPIW